jgi:hypothetical protein
VSLPFALRGLPVEPACCGLVLHDAGVPFVCGLAPGHVQRGEPWHMAQGRAFIRCWHDDSQVVLRGGDVPASPEPASVQLRLDDIRALEGM